MRKLKLNSLKNTACLLVLVFFVGVVEAPIVDFSKTVYANDAQVASVDEKIKAFTYQNKGDPFDNNYPATFDTRSKGVVIDVSNQGNSNLCWSFAIVSAVEVGYMLKTGKEIDLSEKHFAYALSSKISKNGFNRDINAAGSFKMGLAYLTRWEGPVLQIDDPYTGDFEDRTEMSNSRDSSLRVQGFQNVSTSYSSVKKAILEYGSAVSNIYVPDNFSDRLNNSVYNTKTYGYYNPDSANIYNHAVLIIGWDNDFPASNFSNEPPINGAWIVKNSWGDTTGDKGYIYVSYADANILKVVNSITGIEKVDNQGKIYLYDPFGETASVHFNKPEAWFANIFTVDNFEEEISEVSFYLPTSGAKYEIYIGDSLSDRKLVAKGICEGEGYYSVKLDKPISLKTSTCVVSVKLTKEGGIARIPIESNIMGYVQNATAQLGQSYISSNGKKWIDMVEKKENTNVCVRIITKKSA